MATAARDDSYTAPVPADLPPPPRARRRIARRALAASGWAVVGGATLVALAVAIFAQPTDAARARREARRLLPGVLDPGERLEAAVFVHQRHWWDYFRATHGVLAATDRRLVYVALPPVNVLVPDDGPPTVVQREFAFDTLLLARPRRVPFGGAAGVTLGTGEAREALATVDATSLDRVLARLRRRQDELRAIAARERAAALAAAEAARRPVFHVVRRGEALDLLARMYGTPVDSLRTFNQLATDRVRVGQQLMVKRRAGDPPLVGPDGRPLGPADAGTLAPPAEP